ncbi:MAG: endolytic transglycosylase MltG [Gemmatimonadaceae bacterium]|nr:endolytic transglycosylase MltG [Gemmatimonadaceae bacterium]
MTRGRLLALAIGGLLAYGAAWTAIAEIGGARRGGMVKVDVPTDATLGSLGPALSRARIVRVVPLWRLWLAATGRDTTVRAGRHLLQRGSDYGTIATQLARGDRRLARIVIPEGWTVPMIVGVLADSLAIPRDSVLAAVRDSARRAQVGTTVGDLEGYLFPATYEFLPGTRAREVVDSMLVAFERRWRDAWDDTLRARGWTRQQAVTLASIVEREAQRGEERPLIAAVYRNRLATGMRLQADPTVLYGLGIFARRVTFDDLRSPSPYNTYRVAGLPPGPIANPGRAALEAAIAPAADDTSLFFVAFPDGHHEFHATFTAHRAAVARARAAARR